MKTYHLIWVIALAIGVSMSSCEKEEVAPQVDENGLTNEINEFISPDVLAEMKSQGMRIHGGDSPPDITGTYHVSPFILIGTNIPTDVIGQQHCDLKVTFDRPCPDNLTIQYAYEGCDESANDLGAYIVGSDGNFSVFLETRVRHTNGSGAQKGCVISGTIHPDGLADLVMANWMLDNEGNPTGVWIENGQGRVIHDQDGISEHTTGGNTGGGGGAWHELLPDCPCTLAEARQLTVTTCPDPIGHWDVCWSPFLSTYHFGASDEVRWFPQRAGDPGQQCCYDEDGNLITAGIAAGSPDKVSPGSSFPPLGEHMEKDVKPWERIPCTQYLRDWPANQGNDPGCPKREVSGISHMSRLVGTMTCEQVTALLKRASSDNNTPAGLADYLLGRPHQLTSDAQILQRLQTWQTTVCSGWWQDTDFCEALAIAITNMGG